MINEILFVLLLFKQLLQHEPSLYRQRNAVCRIKRKIVGSNKSEIIPKFSKNKYRYNSGAMDCSLLFMVERRCYPTGIMQCNIQRQTEYDPTYRQSRKTESGNPLGQFERPTHQYHQPDRERA